jgi:glutaredoxin
MLSFINIASIAQIKKEVELIQKRDGETLTLIIKNNSDEQKEVDLKLDGKGTCKINKSPITKTVKSGEEIDFITLTPFKGKKLDLNMSYNFRSKPTTEELAAINRKLNAVTVEKVNDFNQGIIVFGREDCPRCERTIKHLIRNNISFKYINTSKSIDLNTIMWKMLKDSGAKDNITMPVIIVDGELSHSHIKLEEFYQNLTN